MLYHKLIEEHLVDTKIVLSDGNVNMNYEQIHEKVAQYCDFFQKKGLKKGERIIIMDVNPIDTVIALLACIAQGIIFVPVNCRIDEKEKEYIYRDCSPAMVLTEPLKGKQNRADMKMREVLPEETLAYIIYTSGTEGIPKGVTASQKQIYYCSEAINRRLCNTKRDRILCSLPLSFDYGLYQIFLSFFSAAVLYLTSGEVIQRIPYLLRKWRITAFPTIPTVVNLMLKSGILRKEDTEKLYLRYITFTGEVLSLSLIEELKSVIPEVWIVPMYGMTECKRVSVMPPDRDDKTAQGSCGLPLDGVRVWLKNKDPLTGIGELIVAGNNVMEGYWGIPDQLTGVFESDRKTGERILHTGDLFQIDKEGFLYFCGRKNGYIKIRGRRVSSLGIENQLGMLDGIQEIAVIGIPDAASGEKAAIFVYPAQLSLKKKVEEKMKELPEYLQNYEVYMCKEHLPQNKNGKRDLKHLQRMIEERQT